MVEIKNYKLKFVGSLDDLYFNGLEKADWEGTDYDQYKLRLDSPTGWWVDVTELEKENGFNLKIEPFVFTNENGNVKDIHSSSELGQLDFEVVNKTATSGGDVEEYSPPMFISTSNEIKNQTQFTVKKEAMLPDNEDLED